MRRFTFADHSEGRRPHKPPAAPPTPWLAERLPPAMLGISMGPSLDVILETPTLLAVNKPADLVCHPTKGDAWSSLISRARMHCGEGFIPRLVNRLDRETSGLVLLAKNTDAAGQLGRMWELGRVQKTYLAVVHGHPSEDSGQIDARRDTRFSDVFAGTNAASRCFGSYPGRDGSTRFASILPITDIPSSGTNSTATIRSTTLLSSRTDWTRPGWLRS
jgi:hypothetical protein